ncbi:uncharacterized protein LOC107046084 [Diachasma alloeum]|uniref:uncharacterized protein LOC107046084 n=1 Tax=Diachasma alloeum TaxID=454923 RepID=UPI00073827FF|nr:uncharacterized protein LOC107046084 [Diachasma alloeum]XP_015124071.1 uncharacterized protein LOC107046084 [Diachasma alloeum]XP_015124072.1 uncharacterized protein LOC107046084 [Diachasma alloeum]XP_015124073.1 uncharacterized protein LOC107046084 [Diachasma alloeum]
MKSHSREDKESPMEWSRICTFTKEEQCQKLKNTLLQRQNDPDLLVRAKKFTEAAEVEKEMETWKREIEELSKSRTLIVPQTQKEAKNDPETMIKCLTIIFTMAQATSVTTLTSTLRSLFNNLALPSIDQDDAGVQAQALKAVGVCLFLDVRARQEAPVDVPRGDDLRPGEPGLMADLSCCYFRHVPEIWTGSFPGDHQY